MYRKSSILFLITTAALAAACSMANIGNVRTSPGVTRQFENLEINPSYRYWYLNQENNPFGVVGLDREYRFDGGPVWVPLDPDSATFKKVVGLVQSFPMPRLNDNGLHHLRASGTPHRGLVFQHRPGGNH